MAAIALTVASKCFPNTQEHMKNHYIAVIMGISGTQKQPETVFQIKEGMPEEGGGG